ncbi:MAG: MarR family transcriptional regulator [Desulfovibrio sp.]|nr:MAG: MarR family transcriptional regulator [Desulfovibrio sp.]
MASSDLDYDIDDSLPRMMGTCVKLMRESLNARFQDAGYDITIEQWIVLLNLWRQDGLSQQALADRYGRSKVAAFKLLEKLEDQGLVMRQADPVDARCKRVFLTTDGKKLQAELVPLAKENITAMTRDISQADLETAKQVIRKVTSNLLG